MSVRPGFSKEILDTSTLLSGFTAGSVLFVDSVPSLAEDNANFFWDDTNNYLGIGTNSPGSKLEIVADSDEATVLKIDQETNDYTGTATNRALFIDKTVSTASGTSAFTSLGIDVDFINSHIMTGAENLYVPLNVGFRISNAVSGAHTATPGITGLETNRGGQATISRSGTIATGGTFTVDNEGMFFSVADTSGYNSAGNTLNVNNKGLDINVSSASAFVTAGTVNRTDSGVRLSLSGDASGTSVAKALNIDSVTTDYDTRWALFNNTTADNFMGLDNSKSYWGTDSDYSIEWDSSDAVHTITSGDFVFSGGHVGVGKIPDYTLHILETASSTDTTLAFEYQAGQRGVMKFLEGATQRGEFNINVNDHFIIRNDTEGANLQLRTLETGGSASSAKLTVTENNVWLNKDNAQLQLGAGVDAYLSWDGTNIDFSSNAAFDFMTATDTDLVFNFIGTTNSGVLTWMEDEDYFNFSDEVRMTASVTADAFTADMNYAGTGSITAVGFKTDIDDTVGVYTGTNLRTLYGHDININQASTINDASGVLTTTLIGTRVILNNTSTNTASLVNSKQSYGAYYDLTGDTQGTNNNNYAIYINDVDGAHNNYGIFVADTTTSTKNRLGADNVITYWGSSDDLGISFDGTNGIYGSSTFAGNHTFSSASSTSSAMYGIIHSSSTDGRKNGIVVKHVSSGDMVDQFGSAVLFTIEDTAAVENNIARIEGIRDGADNTGAVRTNVWVGGVKTLITEHTGTALEVYQDLNMVNDNDKIQLGAAQDASITYDGTDLIIKPDVIGTGAVKIVHDDASSTKSLVIDHSSTAYTGSDPEFFGIDMDLQISTGASASLIDVYGFDFLLQNSHAISGAGVAPLQDNYLNKFVLSVTGAHSAAPIISFGEHNYATDTTLTRSGTLTSTKSTVNNYATNSTLTDTIAYNKSGAALTVNNFGMRSLITSSGAQTAGTMTKTSYGLWTKVTGTTDGSSSAYGLLIDEVSGTDSNVGIYIGTIGSPAFGIWDASGGSWTLASDNQILQFGTAQDASITYDGTDLVIKSNEAGSGTIKLNASTNWTANGANTVTISNVAPAGVGTATIGKWLTVKDDAGTVYYIPAWT